MFSFHVNDQRLPTAMCREHADIAWTANHLTLQMYRAKEEGTVTVRDEYGRERVTLTHRELIDLPE